MLVLTPVAVALMLASTPQVPVDAGSPAAPTQSGARQQTQVQPDPGDAQEPADSERSVTGGVDVTVNSAFVWRGFVVCDSTVVQPAAWVAIGPVTVTSWSNIARSAPSGRRWTEHDLTVDYSWTRGDYTVSAGWINYFFIDQPSERFTNELYVGVSHQGLVEPGVWVFQDVQAGSGTYILASLGLTHEFQRSGIVLTSTLGLGYNHRLWMDASGFSDTSLTVEAGIPTPVRGLVVRPIVGYSHAFRLPGLASRFTWGISASLEPW